MKTKKRFNKLTAWLLTLAMIMTFIPSFTLSVSATDGTSVVTAFAGGTGTKEDPFLISNLEELIYFNEMCAISGDFDECGQMLGWEVYHGAYFKLTADIDCSDLEVWTPRTFAGHFDGDGHKIYNLNIGQTSQFAGHFDGDDNINIGQTSQENAKYIYYGFFDVLFDGSISNITFENVELTIPQDAAIGSTSSVVAGVVAGEVYYANVDSVTVKTSAVTKESSNGYWYDTNIGGIAGSADGAYINNCSVIDSDIKSNKGYTGGLVGRVVSLYYDDEKINDSGYIFRFGGDTGKFGIENSMIDADSSVYVYGNYGVVGGMVGWLCPRKYDYVNTCPGVILKNCYSNASIEINQTSTSKGVGGIVGEISYAENPATIENCYFAGEITDNLTDREGKGAIVGYATRNDSKIIEINNCYGLGLKTLGTDALYNVSYGGDSFKTPIGNATFDTDGILTAEVTDDTLLGDNLLDALNAWVNNKDEGYNSWTATETYPVFGKTAPTTYTVTVSATPTEGGTVTGGGIYEEDTENTVTATANEGYAFDGWYENGIYQSSDASYTFTATEDCELVAKFTKLYTVTFHANNGTDDTASERVADGSPLTLTNDIFTYGKCEIKSWNTKADGSGENYPAGDDMTVSDNVTLYAQWVLPLNRLEAFSDGDLEWSGNASAPYTFKMKNGTNLFASVIFPARSSGDKTTIIVDGNSEIKGNISFESGTGQAGSYLKADLTIKGNGALQFHELSGTGSGDTFTVETDVTITSNYMFIGASGGTGSKIVIKDANLTLHDLTLLQYLTMEENARLDIIGGNASFNDNPEISLSDNSVISIDGNGYDSVLYKEGLENKEAFDALINGGWLPEGCYFVAENNGYYLYDAEGNLKLGNITIKKETTAVPTPGGGGGTTRYTVKFDTDGGTKIAIKTVTRNSKLTEPEAPTKDGYTFNGWYTDKELTKAYDFETKVTKNFTLYAKWDKIDDETDKPDENDKPGTSGHDCPSLKFGDLDISQWYHLDTDYVLENGLMKGTATDKFAPNDNLTRAMLVTVLYRLEGEPEMKNAQWFEDVAKGQWYSDAVAWATFNGITMGYGDGNFGPDDYITREQIAAIMHRYAQYKGYDVTVGENTNILSYDDFDSISEYAIASMQWAVGSGLMKGKTTSTLNPLDHATRAEIAAILHRFIEANK